VNGVVKRPVDATNVTLGLDHGITRNSTLRAEFRTSSSENRNQGVGEFNMPERAFTRSYDERQLRTSVQTVLGKKLNELRLQFNDEKSSQIASLNAPTIVVIDAFTSGGANVNNLTNNRTWEVSDDFDFNVRKHAMRVGMRLEGGTYQQQDGRNQSGTFTFGSIDAYEAGTPTSFTQRVGNVKTDFGQYQLGVYWQDDFRINRTLSLSVGVRQEAQTNLSDRLNLMPRIGYTWNPFGWKTTVRGGYGIFHDWFGTDLYDQTQRVNGEDQSDILILNPGFPNPGSSGTFLRGGLVVADPAMKMPYVHQASIGVERPLSPSLTVQASLALQRGGNQLRSVNINAPDASGVRPQPGVGTITQIQSTGKSVLDRAVVGFNYRIPKYRFFIVSNYTLSNVKNYTDNPLSLPANSLDPDGEWGPANQDVRHRFTTLVNFPLPWSIRANINGNISSGTPYTIITGTDDNGDGVTNDRPAGVGRNSQRGAARSEISMRVTRGVGFGGTPAGAGTQNQTGARAGGPPPAGPPAGGGAGFGGPGGAQTNQRFTVEFYAQAFNLLNHTNYQNYSGNMLSSFFLSPTSASQPRRVEVGMQFRF